MQKPTNALRLPVELAMTNNRVGHYDRSEIMPLVELVVRRHQVTSIRSLMRHSRVYGNRKAVVGI